MSGSDRSTKRALAEETLRILEAGEYRNRRGEMVAIGPATAEAVAASRLYRTEDFPPDPDVRAAIARETRFEVTGETTLAAAARLAAEAHRVDLEGTDPFVLNFASAKNPGGGFLGGAEAQEESLARSSALYPCLQAHPELYAHNRRGPSCRYSDWMIYAPRVPVFRADDGALLDRPYAVSFLTAPAVNAGVVRRQEPQHVDLIDPTNRERARKLLRVAAQHGHHTLLLGAWGCGVFQNDPAAIAGMFADLLHGEFADRFARVVMAVYDRTQDRSTYRAFADVFG